MKLILDIETDVIFDGRRKYLDPWTKGTQLVSVGVGVLDEGVLSRIETFLFAHDEMPDDTDIKKNKEDLQSLITSADTVICHNAQFDIPWMRECGFVIGAEIYDTMLASYILARGLKESHSLANVSERLGVAIKKSDLMDGYYKSKTVMSKVPLSTHLEYLEGDIQSTAEVYLKLQELYAMDANVHLQDTLLLTNQMCSVLCEVQQTGVRIDRPALNAVREEYEHEIQTLKQSLQARVRELMGDTPVNLSSVEQLSQVIYSRKIKDKETWASSFSYWMKDADYKTARNRYSSPVAKTKAERCTTCKGKGLIRKVKINGDAYKNENKCDECQGHGFFYRSIKELAGLKLQAPTSKWVADAGFSTSKENLYALSKVCQARGLEYEQKFLEDIMRLNAIESYVATFCYGIDRGTRDDGILHTNLLQFTTATGRLSGREPNLQNQPQVWRFPIRKVFRSRWEKGNLMEADYAQLEFRVAAFLSQDEVAMQEIAEGFDVHSYTAQTLTDAGEPTNRQEAKAHTFKPLYGGLSGTPAQVKYYTDFLKKYAGIDSWQEELCSQAVKTKHITLPSGREYHFPHAKRNPKTLKVQGKTKIVNYPVQGFATGDIVPLAMVELSKAFKAAKVKSVMVLTVHDSILVDVYPGEEEKMAQLMRSTMSGVVDVMKTRWDVDFNVELPVDIKIGSNWMDTKEV